MTLVNKDDTFNKSAQLLEKQIKESHDLDLAAIRAHVDEMNYILASLEAGIDIDSILANVKKGSA